MRWFDLGEVGLVCVLKFGGTSVANVQRIRRVADLVLTRYLQKGRSVVVVVSAMAGMTDQLFRTLEEMSEIDGGPRSSEEDLVLSTGESMTTALLAMALEQRGIPAQSFLGWQLPLVTDQNVRQARILYVTVGNLLTCLDEGRVPVVAGFQGVTEQGRITTLGRGGSDTTAVAIAAALRAEVCDIFTDVDGVYTADPRQVPQAFKRSFISFEDMLEMAAAGAKVLQARSVVCAAQHGVPVRVLSSFVEAKGTVLGPSQKEEPVRKTVLTGITVQKNLTKIELITRDAAAVLKLLWSQSEPLELLTKDFSHPTPRLDFLVTSEGRRDIEPLLTQMQKDQLLERFDCDSQVARVALVGPGVGLDNTVPLTILEVCQEQNISLRALSLSPQRVDVVVDLTHADLAVLALHAAFETALLAAAEF